MSDFPNKTGENEEEKSYFVTAKKRRELNEEKEH
jgi:hypothetical protein